MANFKPEILSLRPIHLRFPIGPVELIAVDRKPERIRAVGGNGFPLLGVDGDTLDALQASVGVAQTVSLPVDGQGVR